ncbi:hypothetical protein QTJ16_005878 [Diplocarpon rosae]|uniref:polynucleotide adenylyltransferase n=1 Tax=Diplocarpon rosae TaxID=946125 RepID=A0AAD9SW06_9HELO|nr:hypothetical protein QTJ16_005878 [Diplocarpon rosae]PBP16120.1 pap 25a associated domain family protein [Diplocarpon rosae]
MEHLPSAAHSQYQYQHSQATQWSRLVRRNTLAAAIPSSSPSLSLAAPSQRPQQLELIPVLLPQHSSYHLVQLAHYNRLITTGRTSRLQSSPLPPLLSPQHIQAVPGQRSSPGGGITARGNNPSVRVGHGNREARRTSQGERVHVTDQDKTGEMPSKKAELSQLPIRPYAQHHNPGWSHQSISVPSTPHQHAREFSSGSREVSPNATNNHSPRSAYSESSMLLPPKPQPAPRGGCRFETAMAHSKRRMPYNLGDELLEKLDPSQIKSKLAGEDERRLSADMKEMYDSLLPTPQSDRNREHMVQKLEDLFNGKWPGHDIRVHVFGSSGNLLCTDSSDVDICITTEWKEMEKVCMVADLLAKNRMEKVICIPNAKVPIVKIWDPELELACDMNVNNPLALENTRMIKTYVQIDPRVRPLAMIIKKWTKERIVNDAAFGCTLSSYTWICMIIYFLQTRNPPILPALHQRPHNKLPPKDGVESAFADDLQALAGFGAKNKESLGDLLFHFFRFYSHEFDYENTVISVRNGKPVSKVEKDWHRTLNNRLCVEEPFNVCRNLGNTADDTSFRGLHLELRRAFDLIAEGKLKECCERYIFPKEEERPFFTRPKKNPAVIMRSTSSSSRGRGGGHRGSRHSNRNGNSNRRASSGAFDHNLSYIPGVSQSLSPQQAWMQSQAQAQLSHDLHTTYSFLQQQENTLRLQLLAQSQAQAYAHAQAQAPGSGSALKPHATGRNRTSSVEQPPSKAPTRPDMYFYPLQYPASQMYPGYQAPNTNPPSPSLSAATPELRRGMHRSTAANDSGQAESNSALRSQSQPATRSGLAPLCLPGAGIGHAGLGIYHSQRPATGQGIPSFIADQNLESGIESSYGTMPPASEDVQAKEYVGYYVNDPTQFWKRHSALPPSIPTFGDLGQTRASPRRLSTEQLPQSILDRMKKPARSSSPLGHERAISMGAPLSAMHSQNGVSNLNLRALNNQAPAVVNGSHPVPLSIPNWRAAVSDGSASEDRKSDVTFGALDSFSQASRAGSDASGDQDMSAQLTPRDSRQDGRFETPMVVNGSTPLKDDNGSTSSSLASSNGYIPQPIHASNGLLPIDPSGPLRLSPNSRNRLARQNGGVSPLDIGSGQEPNRDDLPHLSPVYENRTPSPTANRKFEPTEKLSNGLTTRVDEAHANPVKAAPQFSQTNGNPPTHAVMSKTNGHTRASKSEGTSGNWQKIQKSKKKAAAPDVKNTVDGQPRAEKLPAHLNERKGG